MRIAGLDIGPAQAPAGKVTVVTSFSKDVTDPVKKAFEAAVPGVILEVQNRNTNAGVKYLEETKANNQVDLFWASAPDAFEVLKGKSLLQTYKPKATGIPEKIGQFPINDPAGFYFGFAASGYGIMWNERYAKANKLPEPKEWQDLAKPVYYDHVSIAAPSRSGTTHLTIEAVLQGEGWAKGWAHHQGDGRQFPQRHRALVRRAGSGQFRPGRLRHRDRLLRVLGAGLGLSGQIHLSDRHHHRAGQCRHRRQRAEQGRRRSLRRYLLSPAGQQILFEPGIRRLPVNPDVYAKAPADYPNPFKDPRLNSMIKFDVAESEARNDVVDVLFDQLISFPLDSLKAATKAIHEAEAALAKKDNAQARALVAQARELIAAMPVDEATASAKETTGAFTGEKQKGARQAELEQQWAAFAKDHYAQAQAKAGRSAKLAK